MRGAVSGGGLQALHDLGLRCYTAISSAVLDNFHAVLIVSSVLVTFTYTGLLSKFGWPASYIFIFCVQLSDSHKQEGLCHNASNST